MAFNEDSRVKIPSLLHLTKLGYVYLLNSMKTPNDYDVLLIGTFSVDGLQPLSKLVPHE